MTPEPDSNSAAVQEDEINLLDLLMVVAKQKKLVLGLPLLAAVLAAGISLLMANIYTATTRILPPQQSQSTAAAMLGQLGGLAGLAGNSLGIKNPNDLYVGMLKSRTVADNLIARFKLQARYEKETMVETRKALADVSAINAGKDGIISIEVDDEDPQFAAQLANGYVDELYKLTQTLAVSDASQRRLFFEKQLQQSKDVLAGAEQTLRKTQEKTGLLQLDAQGQAMITAIGDLRAQVAAREVQLSAMRTFATEQNPDYIRTQQELVGLRTQLAKLEKGGDPDLMPTGKLPKAGLEYVRSLREVKYAETLFELMAKQYELARIDEAKDASLIQVLDKAVPPDRKSKPKRSLIVILSALAVGFLALLLAFVREAMEKSRNDPESASRMAELRAHLKWR